jgi:hypothetical protein
MDKELYNALIAYNRSYSQHLNEARYSIAGMLVITLIAGLFGVYNLIACFRPRRPKSKKIPTNWKPYVVTVPQDASDATIIHQLGRFFLYDLSVLAEKNAKAAEDLQQVDKWLNCKDTDEQYEKFAKGFVIYHNNKASTLALKQTFEAEFGQDAIKAINVYDNLFGEEERFADSFEETGLIGFFENMFKGKR